MNFFDRFRKIKKADGVKETAADAVVKPAKKEATPTPKEKVEKEKTIGDHVRDAETKKPKTVRDELDAVKKGKPRKGQTEGVFAHRILLRPVVSEKSAHLHGLNQYIFMITPDANKVSVKKAIFEAYHVEPVDVKIISMKGKKVRHRMTNMGQRKGYKKAIVCMPKGTSLPVYEGV